MNPIVSSHKRAASDQTGDSSMASFAIGQLGARNFRRPRTIDALSSLSPREPSSGERAGERGILIQQPPLPGPLLHFVDEREKNVYAARAVSLPRTSRMNRPASSLR